MIAAQKTVERLSRFFARFRHPVALPEDVAETFGFSVSNFLSFTELVNMLESSPMCSPHQLAKYMPRRDAESAFRRATCKECFKEKTIVSYYFPEGWIEFILYFDMEGRLRRIYLLHKNVKQEEGLEITLCCSYIGNRLNPFTTTKPVSV